MKRAILLVLLCVSLSGCTEYGLEGKFVRHWIGCKKGADGSWTLAEKDSYDRFNVVHEARYQVSFAGQRVVANTATAFKNCTVYNRGNWQCEDPADGTRYVVSGGEILGTFCIGIFGCSLEVDSIDRITILIGGTKVAERLCKNSSRFLDGMKDLKQKLDSIYKE